MDNEGVFFFQYFTATSMIIESKCPQTCYFVHSVTPSWNTWPNFMVLLTVSTELALTQFYSYGKRISRVSGKLWLLSVRAYSTVLAILYAYKASAEKRGIVIVSAEFSGKQSQ